MTEKAREEVKQEIKEEEISQEVKEEIKEKYNLEQKAKREVDQEQSWEAHKEAMKRNPPVSLGDEVELGVEDIETHHTGKSTAVCRKGGFYIFINEIPREIEEGEIIRGKITSFGKDKTTAQATYSGRPVDRIEGSSVPQCQMCGAKQSSLTTTKVEGAKLELCDECTDFGTEV